MITVQNRDMAISSAADIQESSIWTNDPQSNTQDLYYTPKNESKVDPRCHDKARSHQAQELLVD